MKGTSWVNVLLGVWLIRAPWVVRYKVAPARTEDVMVGLAVLIVALVSASAPLAATGLAWTNLVLALWIIGTPWVMGYAAIANRAATNDGIVGILLAALAAIGIADGRRAALEAPGPPARY